MMRRLGWLPRFMLRPPSRVLWFYCLVGGLVAAFFLDIYLTTGG